MPFQQTQKTAAAACELTRVHRVYISCTRPQLHFHSHRTWPRRAMFQAHTAPSPFPTPLSLTSTCHNAIDYSRRRRLHNNMMINNSIRPASTGHVLAFQ